MICLFFIGFVASSTTGYVTEGSLPSNITITSFTILAETFNGFTTNFSGHDESIYRNFSDVILEKTSYGKIEFNQNLDLVTMSGSDLVLNFDLDLNLSNNLVLVDNENLSGINKNANISIYEISFTNPGVYHNGAVCTDCTFISYSGGIYKFQVSSFNGVYWLYEVVSPSVCGNGIIESGEVCDDGDSNGLPGMCNTACTGIVSSTDGGGGGGGGGGGVISPNTTLDGNKYYNFTVSPSFFELSMNKGTYYQQLVNVTNTGENDLTITLNVEELQNFIFPQDRSFSISPGESKILRFDIYVSNSREADVYVGKIHFLTSQVRKETNVILQVNEREALFDIRTEILKKYVIPGGRVRANVTLINKGDLRNFDVHLEYKVIDFSKNEYTIKKEDFAIGHTYSDVFFLDLPKDIALGNYLFYARVSYKDVNASSYDTFVVEEISVFSWYLLILIILLAMYLAYRIYKNKQMKSLINSLPKKKSKAEKQSEKMIKKLPLEVPKLPDKL